MINLIIAATAVSSLALVIYVLKPHKASGKRPG